MTFGAEIWGPPLASAVASIGSGLLNKGGNSETKRQKQSRRVADELLASIKGKGPYSSLFNADESVFQKSFIDPAMSRFRNQIAPQIQQQYIAGGQQRGTGLDDQLLRAGVELDQLLNENYLKFQQNAQDRMGNTLNAIVGQSAGAPKPMSALDALGQSTAGYLTSPDFVGTLKDIFKSSSQQQNQAPMQQPSPLPPPPKGFARDWSQWGLGDPRWGN
jgi:hypothetical protein